jgi:hypothetical protein
MSEDNAESGLSWGLEVESLVLGILGDAEEIEEKVLLDLLMEQNELRPLLKKWENRKRKIRNKDGSYRTIRDELWYLLRDVTDGNWHGVPTYESSFDDPDNIEFTDGEDRKLCRWIVEDGNTKYITIRRVKDDSKVLKKKSYN